nr:SSU ribosomal protein S19P [uncultured archaeon]
MEVIKKQFTYRGKTIEELKALDVREFAKYLPARQRRTVLRNFQGIEDFTKRAKEKLGREKKIKTHNRDLVIVPQLVGMNIQIYNGRNFIPVQIEAEMLGHRLGEMAITRSKVAHSKAGVGATKGSKHKAKK